MYVFDENSTLQDANIPRYIYGEHSRDKLKVTRGALVEIMIYHQVMPSYLDFMLVFGAQSDPKDLRFSGFREQIRLKTPTSHSAIPALGRSGRHYQLCYNLKSVQKKKKSEESITLDEWSIRQTAVYHQFDVDAGTSLWIVTKGGDDLLQQWEELTGPSGRPEDKQYRTANLAFGSCLSTHLLFCHWSTEDWRWYSQWLEEVLDHVVSHPQALVLFETNAHRATWRFTAREGKAMPTKYAHMFPAS